MPPSFLYRLVSAGASPRPTGLSLCRLTAFRHNRIKTKWCCAANAVPFFVIYFILIINIHNCWCVLRTFGSFYLSHLQSIILYGNRTTGTGGDKVDKLTMGDRIKEVRKKQKLTQEQLAERLDVSVEFIGQIERGLKLPSMQVFIRIIEALNVSADYLLRDSVSTGQLFGDNAIGNKIQKLSLKQRIALEALIDTYIKYLD